MTQKIRSFLIPFITVCIIFSTAALVIAYGRGYRISKDGSLKSTGLIVVQSDPSGAQIIIDDKVKTATQATLTLAPGWYNITVAKEGFQPWHKRMKIQGEVVAKAEALLLPTNPSLTAITASGVVNPILSPDGSRLAYVVPMGTPATTSGQLATTKPGIWILDLADRPLSLNRDARQIAKSDAVNFSKATLSWSPDSKQILASLPSAALYLLETDQLSTPQPVENIKRLQNDWKTIKNQRMKEQLATLPVPFTDVASTSALLLSLSPDETKILYEATTSATIPPIIVPPLIGTNPTEEQRTLVPGVIYVYDVKEDRNYPVADAKQLRAAASAKAVKDPVSPVSIQKLPETARLIHWLPTSRHLVVVGQDKVEIMDYDGVNRRTAYAGPFWDSFAVPWSSGGKLVILTNLNSAASAVNNLYLVNLR